MAGNGRQMRDVDVDIQPLHTALKRSTWTKSRYGLAIARIRQSFAGQ